MAQGVRKRSLPPNPIPRDDSFLAPMYRSLRETVTLHIIYQEGRDWPKGSQEELVSESVPNARLTLSPKTTRPQTQRGGVSALWHGSGSSPQGRDLPFEEND